MAVEGRGFASFSTQKRKEVARKGGLEAHRRGTAREFNSDEARVLGHMGGKALFYLYGSEYFSKLGKKGSSVRVARLRLRQEQKVTKKSGK